jgi:hypothetical protein
MGRAREGIGEAPAEASPIPLGQRAPAHPARHPAHRNGRFVEDAHAHGRASLRSGGRALLTARPPPAPARAQSFDIEGWEPTPDELVGLQPVRPDLDGDIVVEQVVAFRIWARGKDLKFRDAGECLRRLAGFVRLTHAKKKPAKAAKAPRSSAAAASPKRAVNGGKGEDKSERAQLAQEFEELEKLAKTANCRVEQAWRGKVVVYFPHDMKGREDFIVLKLQAATSWLQNRLEVLRRRQGE